MQLPWILPSGSRQIFLKKGSGDWSNRPSWSNHGNSGARGRWSRKCAPDALRLSGRSPPPQPPQQGWSTPHIRPFHHRHPSTIESTVGKCFEHLFSLHSYRVVWETVVGNYFFFPPELLGKYIYIIWSLSNLRLHTWTVSSGCPAQKVSIVSP